LATLSAMSKALVNR